MKKKETRKGWPDIFTKKHFTRSAFRNVVGAACEITILLPVSKLTLCLPFLSPSLLFPSFRRSPTLSFFLFPFFRPPLPFSVIFFFFVHGKSVESLGVGPRWFDENEEMNRFMVPARLLHANNFRIHGGPMRVKNLRTLESVRLMDARGKGRFGCSMKRQRGKEVNVS